MHSRYVRRLFGAIPMGFLWAILFVVPQMDTAVCTKTHNSLHGFHCKKLLSYSSQQSKTILGRHVQESAIAKVPNFSKERSKNKWAVILETKGKRPEFTLFTDASKARAIEAQAQFENFRTKPKGTSIEFKPNRLLMWSIYGIVGLLSLVIFMAIWLADTGAFVWRLKNIWLVPALAAVGFQGGTLFLRLLGV